MEVEAALELSGAHSVRTISDIQLPFVTETAIRI